MAVSEKTEEERAIALTIGSFNPSLFTRLIVRLRCPVLPRVSIGCSERQNAIVTDLSSSAQPNLQKLLFCRDVYVPCRVADVLCQSEHL